MNKNNWKINFFTIWTGQAVSLVTSAVLQMAVIWYLTDTTGSALILSLAAMVGFLPQAVFGAMIECRHCIPLTGIKCGNTAAGTGG